MGSLGIIISIIALLVSLFVAWENYLSPSSINIYSGNPRLETLPLILQGGGQIMRYAVILPLHIVNNGARNGLVQDILLVIHTDDSDWLFYPTFYCDYTISTEMTLGDNLTKKSSNVPYYPISLKGRESIYKSIIFLPDAINKNFPIGDTQMVSGEYQFSVSLLEAGKFDYEEKLVFNITLNDDQINALNTTNRHMALIPYIDKVKNKRQTLRPIKK